MRKRHAFLLLLSAVAFAFDGRDLGAAQLPGGTGSFVEPHGDWTVACRGQNGLVGCVASQMKANPQTGKPMLSVELRASGKGELEGALLLPFGMALSAGVRLMSDGFPAPLSFSYSTCLPGGCIVPVRFEKAEVGLLRQAAQLRITSIQLSSGEEVAMPISLNGFAAALDRAAELAK